MSDQDVSRFITRALNDAQLREQLEQDADGAFAGYDLTEDERAAITAADEKELQGMGIDAMTARSWAAFHDVDEFAPDRPDAPGDLPPTP
jgi:hypothetical protein